MADLHARLAFFLATDALKDLQRANWVFSSQRFETVAEHSWHATLLAMLFEDAAQEGTHHSQVRDSLQVRMIVENGGVVNDVGLNLETKRRWQIGQRANCPWRS